MNVMKHMPVIAALALTSLHTQAQTWELHIAGGSSNARLVNRGNSTPAAGMLHYGFGKGALYLQPELALRVNEHSRFSFGYNVSGNRVGAQLLPYGRWHIKEEAYDILTLHNFSFGYSYRGSLSHDKLQLGGFVKAGMAYGEMTGYGGSGSSGMGGKDLNGYFASMSRTKDPVAPNFWAPATTLGVVLGPNVKERKLADRLTFTASLSVVWKDPYVEPSQFNYSIAAGNAIEHAGPTYHGMPMTLQIGADYSLFQFRKKS